MIPDEMYFDRANFVKNVSEYVKDYMQKHNIRKLVLGLSGGVDSSVAAYLLKDFDKIFVLMPVSRITPEEDIKDAKKIALDLNSESFYFELSPIIKNFKNMLGIKDNKIIGNLIARTRMTILYAVANLNHGIVVGTGDKSEILLGYFTKYGDGGCDILPIGELYKTQVKFLGEYLGVPQNIIKKQSSPRLWKNQTAIDELGIEYDKIDLIFYYNEKKYSIEKISVKCGVDIATIEKILMMNKLSEHKRNLPPTVKI